MLLTDFFGNVRHTEMTQVSVVPTLSGMPGKNRSKTTRKAGAGIDHRAMFADTPSMKSMVSLLDGHFISSILLFVLEHDYLICFIEI